MAKFILSPEAAGDLLEIKNYLTTRRSPEVARYVLTAIRSGIRRLQQSPEIGHFRPDLTGRPVKFWPVFSYLIIYDPVSRPLEIIRVLHGHRDVVSILEEET